MIIKFERSMIDLQPGFKIAYSDADMALKFENSQQRVFLLSGVDESDAKEIINKIYSGFKKKLIVLEVLN